MALPLPSLSARERKFNVQKKFFTIFLVNTACVYCTVHCSLAIQVLLYVSMEESTYIPLHYFLIFSMLQCCQRDTKKILKQFLCVLLTDSFFYNIHKCIFYCLLVISSWYMKNCFDANPSSILLSSRIWSRMLISEYRDSLGYMQGTWELNFLVNYCGFFHLVCVFLVCHYLHSKSFFNLFAIAVLYVVQFLPIFTWKWREAEEKIK